MRRQCHRLIAGVLDLRPLGMPSCKETNATSSRHTLGIPSRTFLATVLLAACTACSTSVRKFQDNYSEYCGSTVTVEGKVVELGGDIGDYFDSVDETTDTEPAAVKQS